MDAVFGAHQQHRWMTKFHRRQAVAATVSLPHRTTLTIASSPTRTRRPYIPSIRTSLSSTITYNKTATMADSMEGVVTEAEKPTTEQTEQQTIAGKHI